MDEAWILANNGNLPPKRPAAGPQAFEAAFLHGLAMSGGSLKKRAVIDPESSSYTVRTAETEPEFLASTPILPRKMKRGSRISEQGDSNTLQGYESIDNTSTSKSSSNSQHRNGTAGLTYHNHNLWDSAKESAKSSYDTAKNGIGHGIDHAGHKLGLWDEKNTTSTSSGFTTSTTTPPYPTATSTYDQFIIPSTNANGILPHETITANQDTIKTVPDHPTQIKQAAKSTTGLGVMGAIIFLIIAAVLGCAIKRKLLRKKGGRYAHLTDENGARRGSTWKEDANSERGILAHEFQDFDDSEHFDGGVLSEEDSRAK